MAPRVVLTLLAGLCLTGSVFARPKARGFKHGLEVIGDIVAPRAEPEVHSLEKRAADPLVVGNFKYISCWTDTSSNRTLRNPYVNPNTGGANNMTVENCMGTCTQPVYNGQYTYFGVEYYGQVYSMALYGCFRD